MIVLVLVAVLLGASLEHAAHAARERHAREARVMQALECARSPETCVRPLPIDSTGLRRRIGGDSV